MPDTNWKGEIRVKDSELFAFRDGELVITQLFYDFLSNYFVNWKAGNKLASKEDLSNINKMIKELQELKEDYEALESSKTKTINKELKEIELKFKNLNSELDKAKDKTLSDMKAQVEVYKKDLNKKFVLELGKPISDKNNAIIKVLQEFYAHKGKLKKTEKFVNEFEVSIPKLDFDKETKNNLLEVCTNNENWEWITKTYENYYSNPHVFEAIRIIINYLNSGYDSSNILLTQSSSGKKKSYSFQIKGEKKKSESQSNVTIEESEGDSEEEQDITDNL